MNASVVAGELDIDSLNREFERRDAVEIVAWAVETFNPHVAVSSSFGAESAVMLHLATRVRPDITIITVDTGFQFPETIAFREQLSRRLALNLRIYRPRVAAAEFVAVHGKMWRSNPDACCGFNKREPFQSAKRELKLRAWIAGIRREQSPGRRCIRFVQADWDGLVKVCPIAGWTARDVHQYLKQSNLPYHPLRDEGYLSIGCSPEPDYCTRRVRPGEDPRAGRWSGFDKTECGLHTFEEGGGI